jgi:hypothetical protein
MRGTNARGRGTADSTSNEIGSRNSAIARRRRSAAASPTPPDE